ncbi:MAG TPA: hypothetical protein VFS05_14740 [Gemmatimonadaceae bacterium]|nr:hypothetical protein [Gemmatimonadaceae bacterium]
MSPHARAVAVCLLPLAAACASGTSAGAGTPSTTYVQGDGRAMAITTTRNAPAPVEGTVLAPIDKVWSVLPPVLEEMGIAVTTIVSAEYRAGNDHVVARRRLGKESLGRLFDCGSSLGQPNAETYEITMSVMTKLEDRDGNTGVLTTVDATARPVNFTNEPIACRSLGVLEKRISAALAQRAP